MLPKRQRLTKRAFDHYFKTGTRWHTPHLQLVYTANAEFHGAIVVGKKVAKTAVQRNRLRRQLYAVLYGWHQRKHLVGVWILLTKAGAAQASSAELVAEVAELVGRVEKVR